MFLCYCCLCYYYLRDYDTHVISLPHPRWMKQGSPVHSIDVYVDRVIEHINYYQIWESLPSDSKDWKGVVEEVNKASMAFKRLFIANLAETLMRQNMVMSGKDLQSLFNLNGVKIVLDHPGGGSAQSLSYKPQKRIEIMEAKFKPKILLIGHYHKSYAFSYRNVQCVLVPALCDKTQFQQK